MEQNLATTSCGLATCNPDPASENLPPFRARCQGPRLQSICGLHWLLRSSVPRNRTLQRQQFWFRLRLLALVVVPYYLCSLQTHLCAAHTTPPTMETLSPCDERTTTGATLQQGATTTNDANAREIDELWSLLEAKDADLRHAAELGESRP